MVSVSVLVININHLVDYILRSTHLLNKIQGNILESQKAIKNKLLKVQKRCDLPCKVEWCSTRFISFDEQFKDIAITLRNLTIAAFLTGALFGKLLNDLREVSLENIFENTLTS